MVLKYRYDKVIPKDVMKLLNRKQNSLEALREPSNLIMYLIFSNLASFIYYLRIWNGNLVIDNGDGIPLEQALIVCEALLTQLLSKDS